MFAFFSFVTVRIAVNGLEKKVKAIVGVPVMIRQIYIDYNLPINPDDLTLEQVHFFYDARIQILAKMQKLEKERKNKNGK